MMSKRQILVVEDNLINREMLVEILSDQYKVLQAENGQEALDILKQNKNSASLILLDVMMPVMDGYTFLDKIKEDDILSLIPVIVTTHSDSDTDEIVALAHGATDFVTKPYRPQVILHRIASIIKLRETAAIVNQFQYDRLTGLYSKEFFYHKVRELLDEDPEQEYTIICSNIENFKLYNDTFGREAGDLLLKEIANYARNLLGGTGFCGRFSADRFLFMQKREHEQQDRKNFGSFPDQAIPPRMRNVVMRWGVYEITDRSIHVEQMCDRALLAADSIKGQYNQYFAVYDDSLRGKLLREKAITDTMESSLSEGQFTVYLQPKYSLRDEYMIGAEALVRWNHPEWGFMSPGEFIPLFERNGFIPRLDQYVWEQVCLLLSEWKKKGYTPLPISVNVSRTDVYRYDLAEVLSGLTKKYDIDPAYLHLEITESAYAENSAQIISTVDQLRKLGFIVEMDDFGSGYSSLNMLSQMKLDIIKLDMKFIQNEIEKPEYQSILKDIISMAHRMRLSVVAEGVETKEQIQRLQAVECDYVQGYFFAKPMPVTEFEELMKVDSSHHTGHLTNNPHNESDMRRLLVIDEDPVYREKVRRNFDGYYHVTELSDAHSALSYISECGGENISAVILSMTLPDNGADLFMKSLNQDPALWKIPVLATVPGSERVEEIPLVKKTDDFLCKRHPMFDLRIRLKHLVDIAESHKRESVLLDEACRDYLTGLLNRRGFQSAVSSLRSEDFPIAVCLFDLDNMKKINDTRGHDAGDRSIRAFADLLHSHTHANDILCRYGGDEFIVIMKHIDDADTAMKKGTEICRMFHNLFAKEQFTASCSGGIAMCGNDEKMFDEIIERADEALYRAKRENNGGCCLWEE